jgi:outer membrane protein OmpA-like peptidoglycan-associated protein
VFIADRSISVAQALAESRLAVDQRKGLEDQRDAMRLAARTQEADSAIQRAVVAQADADSQKRQAGAERLAADAARAQASEQRSAADEARAQASAAGDAAALAERASTELRDQIAMLHAQATERGLVLTLGDVLFTTGSAVLNSGGTTQLGKLAVFLNKYPERTAAIEGHTDNVGTSDTNQALSQHRAESVKAYLVGQSIAGTRLTVNGKGEDSPVGNNETATGRQQNRRVEVIIAAPTAAL